MKTLHYGNSGVSVPHTAICGVDGLPGETGYVTWRPYELLTHVPEGCKPCPKCRAILQVEDDKRKAEERKKSIKKLIHELKRLVADVESGLVESVAWAAVSTSGWRINYAGHDEDPVRTLGIVSLLEDLVQKEAQP